MSLLLHVQNFSDCKIYVNYYTELSMKKLFGTPENNIIYTGNNIIKVTQELILFFYVYLKDKFLKNKCRSNIVTYISSTLPRGST
jgi:hypothetical protein